MIHGEQVYTTDYHNRSMMFITSLPYLVCPALCRDQKKIIPDSECFQSTQALQRQKCQVLNSMEEQVIHFFHKVTSILANNKWQFQPLCGLRAGERCWLNSSGESSLLFISSTSQVAFWAREGNGNSSVRPKAIWSPQPGLFFAGSLSREAKAQLGCAWVFLLPPFIVYPCTSLLLPFSTSWSLGMRHRPTLLLMHSTFRTSSWVRKHAGNSSQDF